MNKNTLTLFFTAIFVVLSCTVEEPRDTYPPIKNVRFNVPAIPSVPDETVSTRAALRANPIGFLWEATDTVGIFPTEGSQVYFSMEDGVGTNSASFDGGGWALKESSAYYSYFPLVGQFYLDPRLIPVSFEGQKQFDATSPISSTRFFLAAKGVSDEAGTLTFNYSILNVILNVNCTLPAGVYTSLSLTTDNNLFTAEGYYNLFSSTPAIVSTKKVSTITLELDNISLTEETVLPLYIMLAPVNLNGVSITVTVTESTGRKYVCEKVPSKAYSAGSRYGLTCNNFTEYAASYPDGVGSSDTSLGSDDEVITIN